MNQLVDDVWHLVHDGSNNPNALVKEVTGLIQGHSYRFRITSINAIGESSASSEVTFIAARSPDAPGQPKLLSSTSSTVVFKWTPP